MSKINKLNLANLPSHDTALSVFVCACVMMMYPGVQAETQANHLHAQCGIDTYQWILNSSAVGMYDVNY